MIKHDRDQAKKELKRLVHDAKLVSVTAHRATDSNRKYSNLLTWMHPVAVAETLQQTMLISDSGLKVAGYYEMMAAAYLHDVVEDTNITLPFINSQFGVVVGKLVRELTKGTYEENLTRFQKTVMELKRISKISYDARVIKVCDIYCEITELCWTETHLNEETPTYLAEQLSMLFTIESTLPDPTDIPDSDVMNKRLATLMHHTKGVVFDRINKVSKVQTKHPDAAIDRFIMMKTNRLLASLQKNSDIRIGMCSAEELMTMHKASLTENLVKDIVVLKTADETSKKTLESKWTAK